MAAPAATASGGGRKDMAASTGWSWSDGDGELRRMSVARAARGRGVAQQLFSALRAHCEERGFKRVVLSTSTMQTDACERLYPKLGFETLHVAPILGSVAVHFFAMELKN